jgi:hypothetical protein
MIYLRKFSFIIFNKIINLNGKWLLRFLLDLYLCIPNKKSMNFKCIIVFFSILILTSCQEDTTQRKTDQVKEAKKKEIIFDNINKSWNFNTQPINNTSMALLNNWAEWRVFLKELSQKPKSSIGAFQQKATTLSKKAAELYNNIPFVYDKPELKSRITVIITKINSLNLYIHLNIIPDKKVSQLIEEINRELYSFQMQLEEIDRKSQIRMEAGESDMIRMLDTARAIPSKPNKQLTPSY